MFMFQTIEEMSPFPLPNPLKGSDHIKKHMLVYSSLRFIQSRLCCITKYKWNSVPCFRELAGTLFQCIYTCYIRMIDWCDRGAICMRMRATQERYTGYERVTYTQ